MRDLWMDTTIAMKNRMVKLMEEWEDEKGGADGMVGYIVMIVIVIALAGIFREKIEVAIGKVFGELDSFIGNKGVTK